ncbi:MAG TPA: ATP-binding protein [Nannocystaceae bacterium]|nr:ATP-binding protein [Nannocystaceae bacterium]
MVQRPDSDASTLSLRRTPLLDGPSLACDVQLIVLLGPAVGQCVTVGEELVLGRATPGLTIQDDGVSRRHASLTRLADGGFMLRDLGSRNGTFVNGSRVEQTTLRVGDRIAIGGHTVLQLVTRDRFEDQRVQAQKLQALGELAGGIAHDFNNLLGVVLANVSHLQSLADLEVGEVRRVLGEVETAARRAGELTHDLMAFARSGPRSHEAIAVERIIEDVTRLLGRGLPRNIDLECETERNLVVKGDAARLTQALTNIGLNAIAAMPKGGVLSVRAVRCEEIPPEVGDDSLLLPAGDLALITVRDNGVGMDPETRRRAFEPFFTTKPRGFGTGLGLATALAIVRDHGGHIAVHSVAEQGTAVHVFLPLRGGNGARPERRTVDEAGPLSGCVLLADDEELVRYAAQRVLEHAGLEVLAASDGERAVATFAANRERIDLVILDLDMPALDGEQAFAAIRQLEPTTRVLISSGYVDRGREDRLRAAGIDGLLDKPYDSLTLLRAIAAALRDPSRRRL